MNGNVTVNSIRIKHIQRQPD